jgi:cell division protein FtsL
MKHAPKKSSAQGKKRMTVVWIILMFFFIVELLFYTWCRVQNVRVGYEITQALAQHQQLVTMHNNLKIETAHLKSPERISKIAREQLGLTTPSPRQVIVLP